MCSCPNILDLLASKMINQLVWETKRERDFFWEPCETVAYFFFKKRGGGRVILFPKSLERTVNRYLVLIQILSSCKLCFQLSKVLNMGNFLSGSCVDWNDGSYLSFLKLLTTMCRPHGAGGNQVRVKNFLGSWENSFVILSLRKPLKIRCLILISIL